MAKRERSKGGEGRDAGAGRRPVVYCVVPADLAEKLHELLRGHFADDPEVEVVVESRRRARRSGLDRRVRKKGKGPRGKERRRVRAVSGRRIAERRATLIPAAPPELPRRARRYAEQLAFVLRMEPSDQEAEDRDTARLVARYQAGDKEAFGTLYKRYYARTYAYMRVLLRDRYEAEDATQEAFLKAFEGLRKYERREQPFRAWFVTVVRNVAIDELRRRERVILEENHVLEQRLEEQEEADPELEMMIGWITDRDLQVLMERLPLPQRQVLLMRYLIGLPSAEAGAMLGRSAEDVRVLQHRALNYLRERLTALGRAPKDGKSGNTERARSRAPKRHAPVLRERRFVLMK